MTHEQMLLDHKAVTELLLEHVRTCPRKVVEDDRNMRYYDDNEDTFAQHGRGIPEPYFACMLDTYGPSISSRCSLVRKHLDDANGIIKRRATNECRRDKLYGESAFAAELLTTVVGDPLGLSSARSSGSKYEIQALVDAEASQARERELQIRLESEITDVTLLLRLCSVILTRKCRNLTPNPNPP